MEAGTQALQTFTHATLTERAMDQADTAPALGGWLLAEGARY